MTQFLYNLSKWKRFAEGEILHYSNPNPRKVRLEVNAPGSSLMMIADPPGRDFEFLAKVDGRDTIEFFADGPFDIVIDGSEVMLYTVDSTDWSVETVDFTSFTRIVERRVRNPEMDYMIYMATMNMEKRLAQQAGELEKQFERRLAKRDAMRAAADAHQRASSEGNDVGGGASGEQREVVADAPSLAPAGVEDDGGKKPKAK